MASPAERMTVDYPVDVTQPPTGHGMVKGKPRKIPASEIAAIRKNRAPSHDTTP